MVEAAIGVEATAIGVGGIGVGEGVPMIIGGDVGALKFAVGGAGRVPRTAAGGLAPEPPLPHAVTLATIASAARRDETVFILKTAVLVPGSCRLCSSLPTGYLSSQDLPSWSGS